MGTSNEGGASTTDDLLVSPEAASGGAIEVVFEIMDGLSCLSSLGAGCTCVEDFDDGSGDHSQHLMRHEWRYWRKFRGIQLARTPGSSCRDGRKLTTRKSQSAELRHEQTFTAQLLRDPYRATVGAQTHLPIFIQADGGVTRTAANRNCRCRHQWRE